MPLFQNVPNTFFSVLSSPNKELYVEALLKLHEMFKYGVNIEIDDYVINLVALIDVRDYINEDGDDEDVSAMPSNKKARLIIAKFKNTGWLDKEYKDGTFKEVIVLHDYSIKTMALLEQLSSPVVKEYNSLVFSTYSSLKQAYNEEPDRMYDALLSAKQNSAKLIDELKSLFHNIRDYHNQVSMLDNINELLQNQFDDYKIMIDKIYHPIKTMDSIHRYSEPIKEILRKVMAKDDMLGSMAIRAMTVHMYGSIDEAMLQIHSDINEITNAFNSVSGILNEIDRKHTAFTRVSIEKMQYLLSADRSVKGKIATILHSYASDLENQEKILQIMQNHICVERQEFIDKNSVFHKSIRSRRIQSEPLKITTSDSAKIDEQMEEMIRRMKETFPANRINFYIGDLLKDRNEINTSQINIASDTDFVILILATIRANDNEMDYKITYSDGSINNNGYTLPNATFVKKER